MEEVKIEKGKLNKQGIDIEKLDSLIKEGKKFMEEIKNIDKAIILIGSTGSGKSTLANATKIY